MQIRYQNVQINITFMCMSFAFRTKVPFKQPKVINVINITINKKVYRYYFRNKNYMQV